MAQCKNCGAKFGCGCQLINGLCAACHAAASKGVKKFKDAIAQINRLR
jgi:cytochrome c5